MHIEKGDGTILRHVYTSHDRWLEDLDDYVSNGFAFGVIQKSTVDLLDRVCAHLNHWILETDKTKNDFQKVVSKINEEPNLQRILGLNTYEVNPELVMYEFDGESVYDEITNDHITYFPEDDSLIIDIPEMKAKLILSRKEFEDFFGGEVNLPEDEEDEIEFGHSTGDVCFFMTEKNETEMAAYLLSCVQSLNEIYKSLSLKTIKIK